MRAEAEGLQRTTDKVFCGRLLRNALAADRTEKIPGLFYHVRTSVLHAAGTESELSKLAGKNSSGIFWYILSGTVI